MKFGLLIEYKMRSIFLERSYTKCRADLLRDPFLKKSKSSISLDFKPFIFIICLSQGLTKYIKPKALTTRLYLI